MTLKDSNLPPVCVNHIMVWVSLSKLFLTFLFIVKFFIGMLSKSKGQILRFTGCLHCLFLVDEIHDAESPGEVRNPVSGDRRWPLSGNQHETTRFICAVDRERRKRLVPFWEKSANPTSSHKNSCPLMQPQIRKGTCSSFLERGCTSHPWMNARNSGTWETSRGRWTP